jgi:hypothetical protein
MGHGDLFGRSPHDAPRQREGVDRVGARRFEPGQPVEREGVRLSLRDRLLEGKPTPDGFSLGHTDVEAVKSLPDIGKFRISGPIWTLECDNDQTHQLVAAAGTITATVAGAIATLVPPAAPVAGLIALKIGGSLGAIETINALGGNNGVEITGVLGAEGLIIVPRGLGPAFSTLAEAARLAVAGRTILEWVIAATSYAPALGQTLSMTGLAVLFNAVSAGTPLGWALSLAAGFAVQEIFGSEPDPNEHGHVLADRTVAGPWETFLMSREGNNVMLLSHVGLFSADNGGGGAVYANRPFAGNWERWTIEEHPDGTASFRTFNGHYLVAVDGGGSFCLADRTAVGPWEKFRLEFVPEGKVALRASGGHYVSVQP